MDIVDAQVHLNAVGIEAGVVAMDALGIRSALIDEYSGLDERGALRPNHLLPNGAARPICPLAEAGAARYPERLAYLLRLDFRDPDLEAVVRLARSSPHARALRVCVIKPEDHEAFRAGEFTNVFAAARTHGFPLFVQVHECGDLIPRYAEEFGDVTLIADHCGAATTSAKFERLLELARYPNVAVKWSQAPFVFSSPAYPFPELQPILRRAVNAFGAERIMWASDFTEIPNFSPAGAYSWADALFYIRESPALSQTEKEWILGRTARHLLNWPDRLGKG